MSPFLELLSKKTPCYWDDTTNYIRAVQSGDCWINQRRSQILFDKQNHLSGHRLEQNRHWFYPVTKALPMPWKGPTLRNEPMAGGLCWISIHHRCRKPLRPRRRWSIGPSIRTRMLSYVCLRLPRTFDNCRPQTLRPDLQSTWIREDTQHTHPEDTRAHATV